ncbi:MAG: DDE-type integrase/transposase/recombinase [Candidatus Pacebacteria bacterium]|nr:DDE-type integrase/transposase/recombinase [Candidatus Paceibacterota bacterium]
MSFLQKIYYDPETGLQGVDGLYYRAKQIDPTITKKEVAAWLKKQETNQVHAPALDIKHYWPIKSNGKDHIWQVDLMDVSAQAHNNAGINFLLCVVDIWTRYAWVVPLKNKEAKTVLAAFQTVMENEQDPIHPQVLMSDNGSEFKNTKFRAFLKENNIKPSYAEPGDHHRMGIVERFNKTIRARLTTYMTAFKTKKYIDKLPKLVRNYNTSPHSALGGSTPSNPSEAKIKDRIDRKEFQAAMEQRVFEVGDKVRSMKNKVMFEKGAQPKWSLSVHTIVAAVGHKRYELDNGKTYLYYQLKPTEGLDEFVPPEEEEPEEVQQPKKERLALKKEGVERGNIREGLRERKPTTQLLTRHGERVQW